ncbi:transposase [Kitasatospora sp. NPDC048194]|uniref:transposase n=1 Tax=Kitasatospora sp. NPDC048194 TaxID=3364045 RepID=UPI003714B850
MSDDLSGRIKPLLPVRQQRLRRIGRPPLDDQGCSQGILYVLHTGIQWKRLPHELGFGSGMTCRRRLRDRHEAGARDRLHQVLLTEPHRAGELDWSPAVIDGSHHQARHSGPKRDRARSTVPARARSAMKPRTAAARRRPSP